MLTKLKNAYNRQMKIYQTVKELDRLGDRELADLGISRCDIRRIARDSV